MQSVKDFAPRDGSIKKLRKIVKVNSDSTAVGVPKETLKDIKAVVVITLIVIVYFIGWLPMVFLFGVMRAGGLQLTAFMIAGILNHMTSVINPFIYALNIKHRKKAAKAFVRRLLTCGGLLSCDADCEDEKNNVKNNKNVG